MQSLLAPPFEVPPHVLARAKPLKLVLFDVDGVLTDGHLIFGDDGQEYKAFNSRDGHGLKMLGRSGIEVGIITGRTSKLVERRAADLGVRHLYQGYEEKLPVCERLLNDLGYGWEHVAFVGDDVVDLPVLLHVGLGIAVHNSHWLVAKHAHWITPSMGGQGAARDVCELVMHAQGTYTEQMQMYLLARARP